MAIKVQWEVGGPFAICDTPAEARELLAPSRPLKNGSNGQRQKVEESGEEQTMEARMDAIFSGINDKAKKLLKALLSYPQGVKGEDFGKVCGTEPTGFGGVLGAISKEAKKVGLTIDDLVQSEARFEGKQRYRWLAPAKTLLEHKHQLH